MDVKWQLRPLRKVAANNQNNERKPSITRVYNKSMCSTIAQQKSIRVNRTSAKAVMTNWIENRENYESDHKYRSGNPFTTYAQRSRETAMVIGNERSTKNSKPRPQSDISNQINALFSIKTTQQCCTVRWETMRMGDKWARARGICHFAWDTTSDWVREAEIKKNRRETDTESESEEAKKNLPRFKVCGVQCVVWPR